MTPWLALGAGAAALSLAFSVYVARTLKSEVLAPTRRRPGANVEIVRVGDGYVTLRPAGKNADMRWKQEGRWGLRWAGGHGRVGRVLRTGPQEAVREFASFEGRPGAGVGGRLEWAAFPDDPARAWGLEFQPAMYVSPMGRFRASFLPGQRDDWVLWVHGKRGTDEAAPPYAYPILPIVARHGFPCLDIAYRNDHGEPSNPDGLHWYGRTEWEDLEGAARYAIEQGARGLVLVGYSMGGAIVTSFLYRSALAERVLGVILDAPVLDLGATVDFGIRRLGVPIALVRPGRFLARVAYGIEWRDLNYLAGARRLRTPILLFHGSADPVVPVATSDRLAELRPDLVTYLRVPAATHGHSWNLDPPGYERAVETFLDRVAPTISEAFSTDRR